MFRSMNRPPSGLDQLVGACASLLVAASMLYLAARVLEAIWPFVLVFVLVAGGAGFAWWRLRRQRSGW